MTQAVPSSGISRSSKRRSARVYLATHFWPNSAGNFEVMDVSTEPARPAHPDLTLPPPDSEKPLPPAPVYIPLALRRLKLPLISRRSSSIYSSTDGSSESLGEIGQGWWNAPLTPRSQRRINHSAVVVGSGNGSGFIQLHSPASSTSRMASPILPEPSPDSEESLFFKQFKTPPPPPTPANDSIPLLNYPIAPHVQAAFSTPGNGIWGNSPARSPQFAPDRHSPKHRASRIPSIVDESSSNGSTETCSRVQSVAIQGYDHEAMVQGYRDLAPSPVEAITPKFTHGEIEPFSHHSTNTVPTIAEQIAQIRRNTESFRTNRHMGPSTPTNDLQLRPTDSLTTLSDFSDLSDISEVSTYEESFPESKATENSKAENTIARSGNTTSKTDIVVTDPPPPALSLFPPISPLHPPRVSSRNADAVQRPRTDLGRLPQISTVVETSSMSVDARVIDGQRKMRRRRGVIVSSDTALIPDPLSPRRPLASHQVDQRDASSSDETISIPSMAMFTPASSPVQHEFTSSRRTFPALDSSSVSSNSQSSFHRSPAPSLNDFAYSGVFTPPRRRLSTSKQRRSTFRSSSAGKAVAIIQRQLQRARNSLFMQPTTTPSAPKHRRILSLPSRAAPKTPKKSVIGRPSTPRTPGASPSSTLVNDTSPVYFPSESPKYKRLPAMPPPQRTKSFIQKMKDSRRHKQLKRSIHVIGPIDAATRGLQDDWLVPSLERSSGRRTTGWV